MDSNTAYNPTLSPAFATAPKNPLSQNSSISTNPYFQLALKQVEQLTSSSASASLLNDEKTVIATESTESPLIINRGVTQEEARPYSTPSKSPKKGKRPHQEKK